LIKTASLADGLQARRSMSLKLVVHPMGDLGWLQLDHRARGQPAGAVPNSKPNVGENRLSEFALNGHSG